LEFQLRIAQVLLCIAASCVTAEAAAPDKPAAGKIDFYLSGMLAERQKIRSGDFVVTGTKSVKDSKRPKFDYSGKVLISCQFDEDRIRIDNLEPAIVPDFPSKTPPPPKMRPGRIERKYLRTPAQSVTWIGPNRQDQIVISTPDTMFGHFLFFDVRGLGLTKWQYLTDQRGLKVEETITALGRSLREKSVDTSDPKYVQIVFLVELATRCDELRYWLRPDESFAPVMLETRTRKLNSPDETWHVNEHAETSWEQTDGVWLPVKFEMTQTEKTAEQKLAWKIRWRSVNKPIDDKRFDWKDFGAPDTVQVIGGSADKMHIEVAPQ
jgi:hypothetical protein